jgi:chemotaxis protein MotA
MDLMTLLGLVIGLGSVYIVMSRGGIVNLLLNPFAALLVFGGTVGAILITYPWKVLKQAPRAMMFMVFPSRRETPKKVIDTIVHLSEVSRRSGIDALGGEISAINDRFLADGIQMLLDALSPDIVRENLEKEIIFTRRRHQQVIGVFRTMGTYSPIFGLLGTLIGVVQVLKNLADPKTMGASMAIAVTTTFYGIFGTNFIFLPIAGKLTSYSEEELLLKEVVIEGILSIQANDVPVIVSRKLQAFLSYRLREKRRR